MSAGQLFQTRLRSANRHQLMIPRHRRSMFGRRAFSVMGPIEWNLLPHSLRVPARSTSAWDRHWKLIFLQHKRTVAHKRHCVIRYSNPLLLLLLLLLYIIGKFCISVLIVVLCMSQWLPESPRFDIARGMPDRAMATLERVARENGKPMPLGKLVDVVSEVRKYVVHSLVLQISTLDGSVKL